MFGVDAADLETKMHSLSAGSTQAQSQLSVFMVTLILVSKPNAKPNSTHISGSFLKVLKKDLESHTNFLISKIFTASYNPAKAILMLLRKINHNNQYIIVT